MLNSIWLVFAAYRIARLIAMDDGPGDVFINLRKNLGAYDYDIRGRVKSNTGRGVSCPHCVGMYAALLLVLLPQSKVKTWVLTVLGVAGAQSFLQTLSQEK